MTTVVKIEHVRSGELGEECPYCKYDDAHKEPCIDCGEMHTPTPESFGRWLHRNFTNQGSKEHTNEVKMYTTHARGGEYKNQIHNLRSSLRSGKPKKLRDWGKGRPKKAVMAVSSPEEGETCNCQHGDHSNANGQQVGMYNQDLGRANWQGQGLPQPKQDKDSCQCDEKPVEADKVPNADARISDKEVKEEKKKFINYSDEEIVEVDGKTTKRKKKKIKKDLGECSGVGCKNRAVHPMKVGVELDSGEHVEDWINVCPDCKKKIEDFDDFQKRRSDRSGMVDRAMTPAQLESRKKKRPYRQTDLRRRKYREKKGKEIEASRKKQQHEMDLIQGSVKSPKCPKCGQRGGIHYDEGLKEALTGSKDKKIVEGLLALKAVLENVFKKRKTRGVKGRGKRGGSHFTGKWRKAIKPLQFKQPSGKPDLSMEDLADKLSVQEKKILSQNRAIAARLNQQVSSPPAKKILPKELGKPSKQLAATKKPPRKVIGTKKKPFKGTLTGAQTKEQSEADIANTKRQKEENTKRKKVKKYSGKKKPTAGEKEKKRLDAKLSTEVTANIKRVDDLKDHVDALGRDKRTQHSTSKIGDDKKGTLKLITPQRKKLQRELLAQEKKRKEAEKKKKKKIKVKPKPKFPQFGIKGSAGKKFNWEEFFRKHGVKKPDKKDKAEENQFGAWGQRGLGDGNGTGAIQGSGNTHLISPVKQKELDKLMAGARYLPRSVSRKKKP